MSSLPATWRQPSRRMAGCQTRRCVSRPRTQHPGACAHRFLSWLYQAMIAQDANFRLKNRLRHSKYEDPWLGPGLAYFVDDKPYHRFIAEYAATPDDVSTAHGGTCDVYEPIYRLAHALASPPS